MGEGDRTGHEISLVQDNNLVGRAWILARGLLRDSQLSEVLHLVPDDINAALVGGVELEDAVVDLLGAGQDMSATEGNGESSTNPKS